MVDKKSIIGTVLVASLIFVLGLIVWNTINDDKPKKFDYSDLDCEIGVHKELDGTWRCLTQNEHYTALAISNSEKLDLIIEKLSSGKYYIDYNDTNGDFEMINEAIDCYNRKGTFSFEFWDNGVFKEWRCTLWYDGRDQ